MKYCSEEMLKTFKSLLECYEDNGLSKQGFKDRLMEEIDDYFEQMDKIEED